MLNGYYYQNLDEQGRNSYGAIATAIMNRDAECVVQGGEEVASAAWKAVLYDNPQNIHYPGLFCYPTTNGSTTRMTFSYSDVDENEFEIKLNELIRKIEGKLSWDSSEYTICKAIFDSIVSEVEYEIDALNEYFELDSKPHTQQDVVDCLRKYGPCFTPYGVLLNKKGVCQGFSKLFKILCDRFRIECAVAEAKSNGAAENAQCDHMINVVEINGVRAFIDLTNCLKSTGTPVIRYDYFLVSQRIINKSFTVPENFGCEDETLNYFVRNNLRFTTMGELRQYLTSYSVKRNGGEVRCFYDAEDVDDEKLRDVFQELNGSHSEERYVMPGTMVKNGFCTGLLTDDEKLLDQIERQLKKEEEKEKQKRINKKYMEENANG